MTAHSCGSLFTLLFLLVLFPCDEDGIASEAPVVEVYFVDDDDGAGRVLVKNIDEKVSGAFDEGGFLFLCDVAFLCNFNVDVWHSGMIQQERQNNIINILGGHSYAM